MADYNEVNYPTLRIKLASKKKLDVLSQELNMPRTKILEDMIDLYIDVLPALIEHNAKLKLALAQVLKERKIQ